MAGAYPAAGQREVWQQMSTVHLTSGNNDLKIDNTEWHQVLGHTSSETITDNSDKNFHF